MFARTSTILHPFGKPLRTPLLVPSFSSKGFWFSKKGKSELPGIMTLASEFITDTMLVSAYDLHHKHATNAKGIAELTIVDSGGYETSDQLDLSDTVIRGVHFKEWNRDLHMATLEKWPETAPAVFVSYDAQNERHPVKEQVVLARKLAGRFPNQLHTLLLKPETKKQRHLQIGSIEKSAALMRPFDIVGVTEKELGSSIMERMYNVWRVRRALDEAKVAAPIHIFGCLDPASICLYFVAGAEIFDGLAWLRYAFHQGNAVYHNSAAARTIGLHRSDDFVKRKTLQDNLSYLSTMEVQMRKFLLTGDCKQLEWNAELIEDAILGLQEQVKNG